MGLQPGDEIVAVNGTEGEAADLAETIRESDGDPVTLTVERGGSTATLEGTPQAQEDGATGSASPSGSTTRATGRSRRSGSRSRRPGR